MNADQLRQLQAEPRLPDPRRAEHGHEVRASFARHALPDPGEGPELAVASDHGDGRQASEFSPTLSF